VRCDETSSSCVTKVRDEVPAHVHAFDIKVTEVCGIDCLACQDEFFVNNSFGVKENNEHALETLLFIYLAFFGLGEIEPSVYGSCFLPRTLA
jgi:hypothetical protein